MSKPIARRVLYSIDDKSKTYAVEVYAPVQKSDGIFECEVRIENAPEGLREVMVGGSDSYQALLLAFKTLNTIVDVFNKKFMSSKLRWHDDDILDLGFSVSKEND